MEPRGVLDVQTIVLSDQLSERLEHKSNSGSAFAGLERADQKKVHYTPLTPLTDPLKIEINKEVELLKRFQIQERLSGFDLVTMPGLPKTEKRSELHRERISSFIRVTGYHVSLGLRPTEVRPNQVYIYEQEYRSVQLSKTPPKLEDFKPSTVIMVRNDKAKTKTLTAYWVSEGKVLNKTLKQDEVKSILHDLPKTSESNESTDEKLIDDVQRKYACEGSRIVMEEHPPRMPDDFKSQNSIVMVQDNKKLTLTAFWVHNNEVQSKRYKLDDLKSTDILERLPKTALSNKSENPTLIHEIVSKFECPISEKPSVKFQLLNSKGEVITGDITLEAKPDEQLRGALHSKTPDLSPQLEKEITTHLGAKGHERHNRLYYYNSVSDNLTQIVLDDEGLKEFDLIAHGNIKISKEQEAAIFGVIPLKYCPKSTPQFKENKDGKLTDEPVLDAEGNPVWKQEGIGTRYKELQTAVAAEMRDPALQSEIRERVEDQFKFQQDLLAAVVRQELNKLFDEWERTDDGRKIKKALLEEEPSEQNAGERKSAEVIFQSLTRLIKKEIDLPNEVIHAAILKEIENQKEFIKKDKEQKEEAENFEQWYQNTVENVRLEREVALVVGKKIEQWKQENHIIWQKFKEYALENKQSEEKEHKVQIEKKHDQMDQKSELDARAQFDLEIRHQAELIAIDIQKPKEVVVEVFLKELEKHKKIIIREEEKKRLEIVVKQHIDEWEQKNNEKYQKIIAGKLYLSDMDSEISAIAKELNQPVKVVRVAIIKEIEILQKKKLEEEKRQQVRPPNELKVQVPLRQGEPVTELDHKGYQATQTQGWSLGRVLGTVAGGVVSFFSWIASGLSSMWRCCFGSDEELEVSRSGTLTSPLLSPRARVVGSRAASPSGFNPSLGQFYVSPESKGVASPSSKSGQKSPSSALSADPFRIDRNEGNPSLIPSPTSTGSSSAEKHSDSSNSNSSPSSSPPEEQGARPGDPDSEKEKLREGQDSREVLSPRVRVN